MDTKRLESFSDAVLAIILTIMVLELKVPHGATVAVLRPLFPEFLSYLLGFIYIGIYWSNHHYLLHFCLQPTGSVLWANLHLLFWLSLLPFVTGWMGQNHFAPLPTVVYGLILLAASLAYLLLQAAIIRAPGSTLKAAVGRDWKGRMSAVIYLAGIGAALMAPRLGQLAFVLVAVLWLVPDRRLERALPPVSVAKS
jgi:uncharacterized membrane protein